MSKMDFCPPTSGASIVTSVYTMVLKSELPREPLNLCGAKKTAGAAAHQLGLAVRRICERPSRSRRWRSTLPHGQRPSFSPLRPVSIPKVYNRKQKLIDKPLKENLGTPPGQGSVGSHHFAPEPPNIAHKHASLHSFSWPGKESSIALGRSIVNGGSSGAWGEGGKL